MVSKSIFVSVLMLAVITLFFVTCKHEIPFPGVDGPPVGGSQPCSADTVYFANAVQPLLNSSCAFAGCHDAVTKRDGVELTSYVKIMSTGGVRPGNPTGSELYKVLNKTGSNRMPPPPYAGFTQAQKDIIYKWILQGAKNNACNGCDTAVFTFGGAINPLMNTYCKGCHNSLSLGGGIDLSTYAAIKAQALNGKLMGSINHASGFSAMPKGGNKFSVCQITQVQKWINAGTPNN